MKLAVTDILSGSAAAFTPTSTKVSNTALNGDARSPDGLGVDLGPLYLSDPLGYVDDIDAFPRRYAVEIKHGRISMLAFVGMAVQELGVTFPEVSIFPESTLSLMSRPQRRYGFTCSCQHSFRRNCSNRSFRWCSRGLRSSCRQIHRRTTRPSWWLRRILRNHPWGISFRTTQIEDPEERDRKLNIEIQNGRVAMLGVSGPVTGAMMQSCLDSTQHHFFYPITHD